MKTIEDINCGIYICLIPSGYGLFYIDNFYGKSYGGNMTDLFRVGVIANTHGVRGEVKVFPTTQEPVRFKKLKRCNT